MNEDVDNVALNPFPVEFLHNLAVLLKVVLVLMEEVGMTALVEELKRKLQRAVKAWVAPLVC